MLGAAQPSQPHRYHQAEHAEVKVAPARVHFPRVVAMPGRELAVRAAQSPATQHDGDSHLVGADVHVPDVYTIEAQETVECSGDAHGLTSRQVRA